MNRGVLPESVTRQAAHDLLVGWGFLPVPGSSRYERTRHGVTETGRIVDDGLCGDTWNVSVETKDP